MMKFTGFTREVGKKGTLNGARREGKIPAVLYGPKKENSSFFVKKEDLEVILRKMERGLLSTTIFELEMEGNTRKVLIKEIQYGRTNYLPTHIDFFEIVENVPLHVNVPIQIAGAMDCAGVKLGGFIRQVIRQMKVACLPQEIPMHFVLDVRDMQLAEVKRLSDIPLPKGVRPLAKMNEVAVVIAKKV